MNNSNHNGYERMDDEQHCNNNNGDDDNMDNISVINRNNKQKPKQKRNRNLDKKYECKLLAQIISAKS